MPDLVNVTIDDVKVAVPAGTLVVDAAKAAGIEIPVFCSHPKLDPLGACRMCLVEFPGPRGSRLDTACTVRVSEGMVVKTDTPQVKAVREANLGFILINHPLDCPICDKGGECPLQDQTVQYGPGASKFIEAKRRKQKRYPISDLIMLDQERCILCWRCIRYLEEWEDKPQLGLFERGGETKIDTFPGKPVDAKTSGSIIDICPVGALTNRVSRFRYRPWELKKTPSICNHCSVGCNLRLDERDHELRRIVARENVAVNDEWICDKGRFVHAFVDHPERLAKPLVRDQKGGELREATWEEALARIVEGLGAVAAAGGVASARISNEAAYLFQKFFRVIIGTNNVDFPDGSAVRAHPTGLSAIADIAKSDLIVLVGFDPSETAPVLDLHIKRATRRGNKAKLLIINPRRIELANAQAAAYLPVLPGNEAALLNELAAAIQAKKYPLLTSAKSPLFIYGPDAATGRRGWATVAALNNLAMLLGQGDKVAYVGREANAQGCRDMGLLPDTLPGQLPVAEAAVRDRLGKLWGIQPPAQAGQSYAQMVGGGVQGLWVLGLNPAAEPAAAEALRQLDFLVVQDLFLTETASLADVVLPSCSFAEADGTYTNLERRVQRGPQGIQAFGESRPDWSILAALAEKWLAQEIETPLRGAQAAGDRDRASAEEAARLPDWKRKKRKVKTGPVARPWNYPNAQAVLEEIGKAAPFYAGLRWDALGEQGQQWPVGAAQMPALGRSVRKPEAAALCAAPVPAPAPGSYLLVSSPVLWDGDTLMQKSADPVRNLIPEPFIALNPFDISASKLAEGGRVMVNAEGKMQKAELVLKGDASVQPGTAWVPAKLAGSPAEMLGNRQGEPVLVKVER